MNHSNTVSPKQNRLLIDSLKKHDYKAFSFFYDLYAPAFYGTIKKVLYKQDISEQTLQDSFSVIWESIDRIDPSKERLFIWSLKIVNKQIRKKKIDLLMKEIFACQHTAVPKHKEAV